ncbi:hypothetical protein ACHAXA_000232 [Cyclostephanos tholiformis]|uniref:Uncharacterized protein n=1 Tax=Cyclostephanos tholiformis TaxID=382380 RepID=A0ABD3RGZ4_9STRA
MRDLALIPENVVIDTDSRCFFHLKEPLSSDHVSSQFILVQAKKEDHRDNDDNNASDDVDAASESLEFVEILPPKGKAHLSQNAKNDVQLLDLRMHKNALLSIVVLSSTSCPCARELLDAHNGHLIDVGSHILEGLRLRPDWPRESGTTMEICSMRCRPRIVILGPSSSMIRGGGGGGVGAVASSMTRASPCKNCQFD